MNCQNNPLSDIKKSTPSNRGVLHGSRGATAIKQSLPKSSLLTRAFPSIRRHSSSSDQRKTRVTFSDDVETYDVKDLRVDYKDELWFSQQEMKTFKRKVLRILKAFEKEGVTLGQIAMLHVKDSSVFMGLEKHLTDSTSKKIVSRQDALQGAVFSEQRRQREEGIYDPQSLANIAAEHSAFCRRRARIIGLLHIKSSQ
mmetsp:Transcript_38460/g.80921  ORF Transcript_38460/g.80921 Transcript_38460/m.80921 type:complete len:198 (+) Transcript_38460:247-840(+)